MTDLETLSSWDTEAGEVEWTIEDYKYGSSAITDWDLELTQLDCTNGNAVCLCSGGRVFLVPARCKKLRDCETCRQWAWSRQSEFIHDTLSRRKIDTLWTATEVTDREMQVIKDRRGNAPVPVDWAWVGLPEGRVFAATHDLTQPRGQGFKRGRMERVTIDAGLVTLGSAYTRADASRRQRCRAWKIPTRSFLLRFGGRIKIEKAMVRAFGPQGDAWDDTKNRRLTAEEIVTRFNAAYDT